MSIRPQLLTWDTRAPDPLDSWAIWRRLRVQLRARSSSPSLDARLAAGEDPLSDPVLYVRARQLTSRRARSKLADNLERAMAHAGTSAAFGPAMPNNPDASGRARTALRQLVRRLRRDATVHPAGVSLARKLLVDGSSPLYRASSEGALWDAAREALLWLDGPIGEEEAGGTAEGSRGSPSTALEPEDTAPRGEESGDPAPPRGRHDGSRPALHRSGVATLTLGALGVVFGDIGTSPLYAIQTVFTADHHAVGTTPGEVYGVISLVFWAIMLIVSIKYVTFLLRADNGGEGGIMALTALLQKQRFHTRRAKVTLVTLGIFGASLFYGDGVITPAISVLSAVEGLKVAAPGLGSLILPITVSVLTMLFVIQRFGTGLVGRLFGPVMVVWFAVLALAGGDEVAKHPGVLRALSPTYGAQFLFAHGAVAFVALGAVVLAVTGAEALYADLGHFGRVPITRAWFFLVFPALTLNYLGQGALILHAPGSVENPFFILLPHWARIPMVLLATVATVIASQAVISGAFSVTRQAVQLGFLPRLTIRHTSEHEVGQVYAPAVNTGLFIAVVALVVGFGSSAALASAYGVAVTGTFVLNSILFLAVARVLWRKPKPLIAAGAAVFLTTEVAFFLANLTKVVHGGWLPLAIAALVFTVLFTWQKGREIVTRNRTEVEGPLQRFIDDLHEMDPQPHRLPGTAVFLNPTMETTPLALRALVEHNLTLHESVVILSIEVARVPHVPRHARLSVDDLGYTDDGISHVRACFGFQDEPDVPAVLRQAVEQGAFEGEVDVDDVSYFLSRITIVPTRTRGMPRWQKQLFLSISRLSANPAEYFALPSKRTVTMGAQVDL